jgi:flavin-dependent dehydrogenase
VIDLIVAGGGPAGLVTALHGARAGLEVVVIEPRSGAIDKACGEGLMPHTVSQLQRLGVQPLGKALGGITYLDGRRSVSASFRSGAGRGVRRTALHTALGEAVTAAGVPVVQGEVIDVTQDDESVYAGGLRARYLAAADGLHSPIRRTMGLEGPLDGMRRWGIRRHVQVAPWTDHVEVYWGRDCEAYVTPVADDCVGIAILTSRRGGFDGHFGDFAALADRVKGCPHDHDRAAGPLRQKVRARRAGRVLLVGDAAGYVDALTGEGLGIAFGAAELLIGCVAADTPGDYDHQWRRMSRRYRLLTVGLLRASRYASVRSRIVPAAAALPAVFAGLVNQLAE